MKYVIGIDGGGTKTVGSLADLDGKILATSEHSGSNYHTVGIAKTERILQNVIDDLSRQIDVDKKEIFFCFGMAGLGRAEDRVVIGEICDRIGVLDRCLTHDAEIALVGGIGKMEGIIVVSGTGSIVFGRRHDGKTARSGGWGHLIGDEGSGYAIAISALRAVAKSADRRAEPTMVTDLILDQINLKSVSDLVSWVHSAGKDQIAKLAKTVFIASENGDRISQKIIENATDELVIAIRSVAIQLDLTDEICVVLAGGILLNQPQLSDLIRVRLSDFPTKFSVVFPKNDQVIGAVKLAISHLERRG